MERIQTNRKERYPKDRLGICMGMKIMKIYKIYFSPTGGTKKAIDIVARAWAQDKEEIDLNPQDVDYSQYSFHWDDICIVAVPSFGGRVPGVALSRLKQMTGGNARAILMAVYGNRDVDDTLLELKNELKSRGFLCVAGIEAVAEHSILRQYGSGRPDPQDEKQLEKYGEALKQILEHGPICLDVRVPGNTPYREYKGVPFKPKGGKKCVKCGICAKECPVQAIPSQNPSGVDASTCISCMRCISVCPYDAREVNKVLLAAASQKLKKACSQRKENRLFA